MPADILLVNPVFLSHNEAERELMSPYFPLGLLYLASYLRERGYSTEIFDGTFATDIEEFKDSLDRHNPKFIGITVVQPNRDIALTLAHIAHEFGATVFLGGPDPTYTPQTYLADPAVDIVVHHEGELTLVELLEAWRNGKLKMKDYAHIPGIAYRDPEGGFVINPRRSFILNLDELPLPARDMIDMQNYLETWREHNGYASLSISLARGCPYGCEWCADSVHGQEFRLRSPEGVVAEVKMLQQIYNIDRLRVVDDVDGIDREWIQTWNKVAESENAVLPFEALYEVQRKDIPMLDIRDSL